jgi:Trk K+ transport system NAD-binding subunit
VQIDQGSPCVGKAVERIELPAGSQLISVVRNGQAKIADGETTLEAGDQVLAILEPGKTDELKRVLLKKR